MSLGNARLRRVVDLILMDPCKVVFLDETNETDITDAGLVINEEL
jgi:hypothetical protein